MWDACPRYVMTTMVQNSQHIRTTGQGKLSFAALTIQKIKLLPIDIWNTVKSRKFEIRFFEKLDIRNYFETNRF